MSLSAPIVNNEKRKQTCLPLSFAPLFPNSQPPTSCSMSLRNTSYVKLSDPPRYQSHPSYCRTSTHTINTERIGDVALLCHLSHHEPTSPLNEDPLHHHHSPPLPLTKHLNNAGAISSTYESHGHASALYKHLHMHLHLDTAVSCTLSASLHVSHISFTQATSAAHTHTDANVPTLHGPTHSYLDQPHAVKHLTRNPTDMPRLHQPTSR